MINDQLIFSFALDIEITRRSFNQYEEISGGQIVITSHFEYKQQKLHLPEFQVLASIDTALALVDAILLSKNLVP